MKGNDIIKKLHKREGVALIITVGILALLVIFGMVFAITARLELLTAKNYLNSVKAKYLAQAGINHAIAELKNDARSNFAYDDNVSISEGQSLGEGTYTVKIEDEQRKININNASEPLLINLGCFGFQQIADIIAYRESKPFEIIEEIKAVDGIGESTFESIRDSIAVSSYEDPNCENRSPVNINTAGVNVLMAVMRDLSDGVNKIYTGDRYNVVFGIRLDIKLNGPYSHPDGWQRFEELVADKLSNSTNPAEKTALVVNNCNPNKDKSGLTYQTTELCFFSGGHYLIESTAQLKEGAEIVAEKKIKSIVKLYDVWNQTTEDEFKDINADWDMVTWKESCPINYDCLQKHLYNPDDAITIADALKIGFWDDFEDEDYSRSVWRLEGENMTDYCIGEDGMLSTWHPHNDRWPIVKLRVIGDIEDWNKWRFTDFSAVMHIEDFSLIYGPMQPRGWALEGDEPDPLGDPCGKYTLDKWGRWVGPVYQKSMNSGQMIFRSRGSEVEGAIFLGRTQTELGWTDEQGECYIYYEPDCEEMSQSLVLLAPQKQKEDIVSYPFHDNKTFDLIVKGDNVDATVYCDDSSVDILHNFTSLPSDGYIALYGSASYPKMDNVRVVPSTAEYISIEPPSVGTIEQGTVSGTVTLLDTADEDSRVDLVFETPGSSTLLTYKANFYAEDENLHDTPVLEDVFVTYFKPTKILYYTEVKN